MKTWIAERCSRARTTVLIQAVSRKEAIQKAKRNEGESVHTEYYDIGPTNVVREDKASNQRRNE